ncbi:hypothetical protein LZ32DRAFT_61634 [Colletotrichum eremochloae]|nr:hypothetical protein LZ32DRAFT_61634 [Colletotrichum eremochloae]
MHPPSPRARYLGFFSRLHRCISRYYLQSAFSAMPDLANRTSPTVLKGFFFFFFFFFFFLFLFFNPPPPSIADIDMFSAWRRKPTSLAGLIRDVVISFVSSCIGGLEQRLVSQLIVLRLPGSSHLGRDFDPKWVGR